MKTTEEREALVTAKRQGSNNDSYYIATCPICFDTHSVDVRHSDKSAEALAISHIQRHLLDFHRDQISGLKQQA